jgi:phosphodiesterase/alkaline phosphatase D-like protein
MEAFSWEEGTMPRTSNGLRPAAKTASTSKTVIWRAVLAILACGAFAALTAAPAGAAQGLQRPFYLPFDSEEVEPPTVVTGAASSIKQTTATLNATVNPNGGEVSECVLEYGTSEAYEASAPCTPSPGSESTPVAVSAAISGLSADTTYHFRVSATNEGGTSTGADQTFKTASEAPTVATGAASSVKQTTATLNATVNPNGAEVGECVLEYGISEAYEASAPCTPSPGSESTPVAVSAAISGLSADTTYHFRVSATNEGGIGPGQDETFKTASEAPTVVTGVASSIKQTTATLNATVNPNGGEVSECVLEYGTSEAYEASMPCSPSPGSESTPVAVSAATSGLSADTTYHFRVSATNEGGTSPGADHTFKTASEAPTVVTGSASSVKQTTATLNATVNPNGAEVSECVLEYGTSESYEASAPCTPSPGSESTPVAVSAAISGLSADTTYHFRVSATNEGGTSTGEDQTFETLSEAPTVTGVSPDAGLRSHTPTTVTITGTNFTGATAVKFGTLKAKSFMVESETSITAVAPEGLGVGTSTVDVTVTTPGGTSAANAGDEFTYVSPAPPPSITKVLPKKGPAGGGTTVTITGMKIAGVTAVRFGSVKAPSFTVNSSTSVTAVSPGESTGTVDVTITTPNGTSAISSKDHFEFEGPTVTHVSPDKGLTTGGTPVTVTGTGFVPGVSAMEFKFGKVAGTDVECASYTTCTVDAPAGKKGVVDVKATVGKVTSKKTRPADVFTYEA